MAQFRPFPLPQIKWVPDSAASCCALCQVPFTRSLLSSGKHHCRKWYEIRSTLLVLCTFLVVFLYGLSISGQVVCATCSSARVLSYRICDGCYVPGATVSDYITKPTFHCEDSAKSRSNEVFIEESVDSGHSHKMSDSTKSSSTSQSSNCSHCKRYITSFDLLLLLLINFILLMHRKRLKREHRRQKKMAKELRKQLRREQKRQTQITHSLLRRRSKSL